MSTKLKLQPFSSVWSQSKSISFFLSNLKLDKKYRIKFENATLNREVNIISSDKGEIISNFIILSNNSNVSGKIDLNINETDSVSVISVYANIEEQSDIGEWELVEISAFSFQIENSIKKTTNDKVYVYPPFVGPEEKATIKVQTNPNSAIHVIINNKKFIVRSNSLGEGSFSFRAIDVLSEPRSSKSLFKFPIMYSVPEDKFSEIYNSGTFINFVPEAMRALQATNVSSGPSCAVIDESPSEGLTLNKLNDFCVEGPVVGDFSAFDPLDEGSDYYNSKIGYCSSPEQIFPSASSNDICRVFNSVSSTLLNDGSSVSVFSSQEINSTDSDPIPANRIYVVQSKTSLKNKGNSIRDGTVIKPPAYYHTVTPLDVSKNQIYSILFRVDGGKAFEIKYTTIQGTVSEVIASFVELINSNSSAIDFSIKAINQGSFIEIKSENKFSIKSNAIGSLKVELKSNKTLNLLVSSDAIKDEGDTIVFLFPKLGYQSHKITQRDFINNIISFEILSGFNNDKGPVISENMYCQKYVVIDSNKNLIDGNSIKVSALPYIKDIYNREVSSIFPVVTSRKINSSGQEYVYIVCQAPVNGVYQLFYFSFEVGKDLENTTWKQLTTQKENKNAKIKCDSIGNLHIVWESDRLSSIQLYYSVLGPSSKSINNQILMSVIDKNVVNGDVSEIINITEPSVSLQNGWNRLINNGGKVSVYDNYYIGVEGDPSKDSALAYFPLSKDEFNKTFSPYFDQLSYQVSFDFWMPSLASETLLTEQDISDKFKEWKSNFSPVNDYKYIKNNNIFTIDNYSTYFENIIPVCGSFNFGNNISVNSGGAVVDDISHNASLTYVNLEEDIKLMYPSNIKHFMLVMMPEKVRFKAKNTESYSQYCERTKSSLFNCSGFVNEEEYKVKTGRYKLAIILSTSENESTGKVSQKNHIISRFLPGYIDFRNPRNIKIAVHYSKMGADHIDGVLKRDKQSFANEQRFHGDIIISVENESIFGNSFLADFSDGVGRFDIGFGFPGGDGISVDGNSPYKGNSYETGLMRQIFSKISISPHTIKPNSTYVDMCTFDRNTTQMVIAEKIKNILPNGGFEETVLPYENETAMFDGYQSLNGWTVRYGGVYRRTISSDSNSVNSWFEITGMKLSNTYIKGNIYTTIPTEIGKKYFVFFDISNNVNSYLQSNNVTKKIRVSAAASNEVFSTSLSSVATSALNWSRREFSFIATSSQTVLKFENASNQFGDIRDIQYGPQIDNVVVVAESDLNDENNSFMTYENLLIDKSEYQLNYSLNVTNCISQIPITINNSQNKNSDLYIDKIDKVHLAWQCNKSGFWDIYYSGSRSRSNIFRFDTQISNGKFNSVNPSIAVDGYGKRLIVWQDNREGKNQIFGAISKKTDDMFIDRCDQDEVDAFISKLNYISDPYVDPYIAPVSALNCLVEFSFVAPETKDYHFSLSFYHDSSLKNLYKNISSKGSISGWKVGDTQISYKGLSASKDQTYIIGYLPSYEDDLSNKVLYVVAEFEQNVNPINFAESSNVQILEPYSGLNLGTNRTESSSHFTSIMEFNDESPISLSPQSLSDINTGLFSGMTFEYPLSRLPGFNVGDRVKSVLIHFDPVGSVGVITGKFKFNSPIVGIYVSAANLVATHDSFAYPGVVLPKNTGVGLEAFDYLYISADRKTLDITCYANPAVDQIRVILSDESSPTTNNQFVYYCPNEQSSRCHIKCDYVNNSLVPENIHFRVTFYADQAKSNVILSSFTKDNSLNWYVGSDKFPAEGLVTNSGQSITASFSPEVLPFEMYESQNKTIVNEIYYKQSLLCGIKYYYVIESYKNGSFVIESESEFMCGCSTINFDKWDIDIDSITWICSGQGFEDFRITSTDNHCLFPILGVTDFDLFYIIWQDFRYVKTVEGQNSLSSDYFLGMYDSLKDKLICSGQDLQDYRLTNFSKTGKTFYDASLIVDPFQNINLIYHDGTSVYSQSCSLGCQYSSKILNKTSCMFTDESDSDFYILPTSSDRIVDQYQKMRISPKSIAYSTYIDLEKPIPVINDCFIELDIIGVPGTLAYRLKNENDEDWSEWLPIAANLPSIDETDSSKKQKEFLQAYFTQRDVFTAPWVVSPNNGTKKVCCQVLTNFGKSEEFCVDFMAIYDDIEYKIDLYFDESFESPVPKFKNYMVVSKSKTEKTINDFDLSSINDDVTEISSIYVRVEFKDKNKIELLEKLQNIERFVKSSGITMNVYQQGLNDQLNLPLTKISQGIYRGSFVVENDDGVINVDGLAFITIDVPGQCKSVTFAELSKRINNMSINKTLDQKVSVFNNFTIFRDIYTSDDIKGSFGNPDYYKLRSFGSALNGDSDWLGGGEGLVTNKGGYTLDPNKGMPPSGNSNNGDNGGAGNSSGNGGSSNSSGGSVSSSG